MMRSQRFAPLAALVLLAGCAAIGGPKTEVSIYAPQTRVQADPAWPAVDWQLTVGTPDTHALLDSQRIAVRPSPDRLQTYKGARWADTAPELVQLALVEAFEDSGKIQAVSRWGGGRGDFGLYTDLRAFETVYEGGTPKVVALASVNPPQRPAVTGMPWSCASCSRARLARCEISPGLAPCAITAVARSGRAHHQLGGSDGQAPSPGRGRWARRDRSGSS